jgi:ribosomal protein L31E
MEAKVIKIGNSYGVRFSRQYIKEQNLRLGQTVDVSARPKEGNAAQAIKAIREHVKKHGGIRIKDPVAWQRQIRSEWEHRTQG